MRDKRSTLKVETIGEIVVPGSCLCTKSFHLHLRSALLPAPGVMVESIGGIGVADSCLYTKSFHLQLRSTFVPAQGVHGGNVR